MRNWPVKFWSVAWRGLVFFDVRMSKSKQRCFLLALFSVWESDQNSYAHSYSCLLEPRKNIKAVCTVFCIYSHQMWDAGASLCKWAKHVNFGGITCTICQRWSRVSCLYRQCLILLLWGTRRICEMKCRDAAAILYSHTSRQQIIWCYF